MSDINLTDENTSNITGKFRFSLEEAAGAVGDFGTIFPIILGVALVSDVNLSIIFLFFAVWYAIAGLYYKLPIPIEPMKAIGAIVIAEGLTSPDIAASGVVIGILFFLIGSFKGMRVIRNYIPKSVIRGVQGGLALLLLKTSFGFVSTDFMFAGISVAIILLFFVVSPRLNIPDISALIVIALGIGAGIYWHGFPELVFIPLPTLVIPDLSVFPAAAWHLAVPQIPLTLTNAILATLCRTIGIMNLISVPFGGFPMCHGAGGLAAQYRFGARTGGANIIAGIILLGFAFFFATPEMLEIIPMGIFGGLLIFVAITLGKAAMKTDLIPITALIAITTPVIGVTPAFIVGMVLASAQKRI